MRSQSGCVMLVGAGPGAVDLLTLRAARAIAEADVILADALVTEDILALASPCARIIAVGKRGHQPSTPQDYINRLMERLAHEGHRVVRLKGGDPSIFGRSAEERAFLESRGVRVEVVPGVTTASAAAAEFAFALTERETARRVVLATGRTLAGPTQSWRADPEATLCLYMGCGDIAHIAAALIASGISRDAPALAAIDVSRPTSELIMATVATLADRLSSRSAGSPAMIVIGEACRSARVAVGAKASFADVRGG